MLSKGVDSEKHAFSSNTIPKNGSPPHTNHILLPSVSISLLTILFYPFKAINSEPMHINALRAWGVLHSAGPGCAIYVVM